MKTSDRHSSNSGHWPIPIARAVLRIPLPRIISTLCALLVGFTAFACRPRGSPSGIIETSGASSARDSHTEVGAPVGIFTLPEGGSGHGLAVYELVERCLNGWRASPDEIRILLSFAAGPQPDNMTAGEWEERVNHIFNLLRRQATGNFPDGNSHRGDRGAAVEESLSGLTNVLIGMVEDHPNVILRLYALQHLSLWYDREPDPAMRADIVALLTRLAQRPGEPTAGSAVLMLADIRRQGQSVTSPEATVHPNGISATDVVTNMDYPNREVASLGPMIDTLIADPAAAPDVRISAIHACLELDGPGPLDDLRRIAMDTSLIGPLRKAAIHALGRLGVHEDLALLASLPHDDNLSAAVRPAIAMLRDRLDE